MSTYIYLLKYIPMVGSRFFADFTADRMRWECQEPIV